MLKLILRESRCTRPTVALYSVYEFIPLRRCDFTSFTSLTTWKQAPLGNLLSIQVSLMRCAFKYVTPHIITLVADPEEGPGGPAPPYFSTKLRPEEPKIFFFGDRPPPPLPKGLDDLLPPSSPLISGSGSGIDTEVSPFTTGTNRTNRPFYSHRWKRHWSWPCFDTTLSAFLSKACCSYANRYFFSSIISIRNWTTRTSWSTQITT